MPTHPHQNPSLTGFPHSNAHAIVIGGSIAGLLAARVLADHFERVTVIERDRYPAEPAPREGVPQSRFLHVLLARGQSILETLFPGLTAELIARGAHRINDCRDIAFFSDYGPAKRHISPIETLSATRGLLDWTIRHRLLQQDHLTFLEGHQVTGLIGKPHLSGISGVIAQADGHTHTYLADLVVDASGKSSKAPQWLQKLGYDAPAETFIDAHIGYAHRLYRRPSQSTVDWEAALIWATFPHSTRSGILYPVEGDRWIVGIGGAAPNSPPTDEAGYLDFARSLSNPAIYEAIKDAEPLSEILLYRGNENRLRAYERLSPYPEHFIVVGHAACAFNPVYAQGMTMAAIEAQILQKALHQASDTRVSAFQWSKHLQQRLSKARLIPWAMATDMDRRLAERGGPLTWYQRLSIWYERQILQLTTRDSDVYYRMTRVTHMITPPNSLVSPSLLGKIGCQILSNRLSLNQTSDRSKQAKQAQQNAPASIS